MQVPETREGLPILICPALISNIEIWWEHELLGARVRDTTTLHHIPAGRTVMAVSDQIPTNSGFRAETDGANVIADVDLAGKTAIVTGGHSGIGLETATRCRDGCGTAAGSRSPSTRAASSRRSSATSPRRR